MELNQKTKIGIIIGVICLWLFISFVIYSFWGKNDKSAKDANAAQTASDQVETLEAKDGSEDNQTVATLNNTTTAETAAANTDQNEINDVMDKIIFENAKQAENAKTESDGKVIGKLDESKFWFTSEIGYQARMVDKAMSQEFRELYKSEDGGASWTDIAPLPSTWAMKSFSFVSEDLGFFCFKWVEGMNTNFYRTANGGVTFEEILLPEIKVEYRGDIYTPFNTPEAPWEENGILFMYDAQDENGDYRGGQCKALLKSEDNGKTWTFTYKIVDFRNSNG